MGGLILAWLVGEGIVTYRTVKKYHVPPSPGQLLYTSILFIGLAIIAQSEKARPAATIAAWGFDIAAFLNLYKPITDPPPEIAWPPAPIPDNRVFPTDTGKAQAGGSLQEPGVGVLA